VNGGKAALKCWEVESFESWVEERRVAHIAKRFRTPDYSPGTDTFIGCLVDDKTRTRCVTGTVK
jgi:hypothetical protein